MIDYKKIKKKDLVKMYNELQKKYEKLEKKHKLLIKQHNELGDKYVEVKKETIDIGTQMEQLSIEISEPTNDKQHIIDYLKKRIKCTQGDRRKQYEDRLKKYLN